MHEKVPVKVKVPVSELEEAVGGSPSGMGQSSLLKLYSKKSFA